MTLFHQEIKQRDRHGRTKIQHDNILCIDEFCGKSKKHQNDSERQIAIITKSKQRKYGYLDILAG